MLKLLVLGQYQFLPIHQHGIHSLPGPKHECHLFIIEETLAGLRGSRYFVDTGPVGCQRMQRAFNQNAFAVFMQAYLIDYESSCVVTIFLTGIAKVCDPKVPEHAKQIPVG